MQDTDTETHHDDEGLRLMEADIEREAATVGGAIPELREAAAATAARIDRAPTRAYLIGCGDSLDAGIAARFAWDRMVDFPVEAVPAMTFATSVAERAPEGSLVVALSQSGKVSRVVEGVRAARSRGLQTVTITANAASMLGTEPSDASWTIGFDKLGAIPGTTSYLLGMAALYELGCELASQQAERDALRTDLDGLADLLGLAIAGCGETALRHAEAMARDLPVLTIGYGPGQSAARFTIRKMLELTQLVGLWQETEEYAHDEYSLVDERFRVLQFAPPDRGRVRNAEIARYLERLGVHLAVITDGEETERYGEVGDIVYELPAVPPALVPFVYAVPGQLLSIAAARRVGGSLYGMAERVHREDGDPQIYESDIAS